MRIKVEFSLYWASTNYRGFWIWTKALSPLSGWKTCPQYQKHHYYSTMLWSFLFTTEQHKSQVIRYLSNPDNHHAMCGRCIINIQCIFRKKHYIFIFNCEWKHKLEYEELKYTAKLSNTQLDFPSPLAHCVTI